MAVQSWAAAPRSEGCPLLRRHAGPGRVKAGPGAHSRAWLEGSGAAQTVSRCVVEVLISGLFLVILDPFSCTRKCKSLGACFLMCS